MAEAPSNDLESPLPPGLLAGLSRLTSAGIRPDEVARGRVHAEARAYDDEGVVEEIASQLLRLSRR